MRVLGKKFAVTKFSFKDYVLDDHDIRESLDRFSFVESPYKEVNCAFAPIDDPWAENESFPSIDVYDGILSFLFRVDTKKIPHALIKKEECKRTKSFLSESGCEYIPRGLNKRIKEDTKASLIAESKAVPSFTPVIMDFNNNYGYILTNSSNTIELFSENLTAMIGFDPIIELPDNFDSEDEDFLTWLWWRIGTNPNKECGGTGYNVSVDNKVVTSDGVESVSCKSEDSEECRISLLRGLKVAQMSLAFMNGNRVFKFTVNSDMGISGVHIEDVGTEDDAGMYYLVKKDYCDVVFSLLSSLTTEYEKSGKSLPEEALKTWSRGDFCTRSIGEF